MPPQPKKFNLFLLDADVVIHLHELNLWSTLLDRVSCLYMSETIFHECRFYSDDLGNECPIDLSQSGKVKKLQADLANSRKVLAACGCDVVPDAGELEALAILLVSDDFYMCSCDQGAIKGAVIIGKKEQLISPQGVFTEIGHPSPKLAAHPYSDKTLQSIIKQGEVFRIQRFSEITAILSKS